MLTMTYEQIVRNGEEWVKNGKPMPSKEEIKAWEARMEDWEREQYESWSKKARQELIQRRTIRGILMTAAENEEWVEMSHDHQFDKGGLVMPDVTKIMCKDCCYRLLDKKLSGITIPGSTLAACYVHRNGSKPYKILFEHRKCRYYQKGDPIQKPGEVIN